MILASGKVGYLLSWIACGAAVCLWWPRIAVADQTSSPAATRDYFVEALSVGTKREGEPPRYVRTLSETGIPGFQELSWLDVGLDYRMRFEYRDDDYRRAVNGVDTPFLLRTRGYLGIREIADPFRAYIEYEDAQRYHSQFPRDSRDVNEYEIIQAVGELYFEDALGHQQPLRLQAGRMAMEYVDRRLIARNDWRNTTNNFEGFRVILGQQQSEWQLDLLAMRPVERLISRPDRVDEERWFWGAVGDWRAWSDVVTLQPYYLVLDQNGKSPRRDRSIHSLGLRGYGVIGDSGYDYDSDVVFQFGENNSDPHRAYGLAGELGYTFDQKWKPRVCGFFGYASGDRNAFDDSSERFDRLFGFGRPWSADDYFLWENLIAPKARIDFQPHEKVRVDAGYGVFWLASDTDSWANTGLRDVTGQSGSFLGHELDIRVRLALTKRTDVILGYAHFISGEFTQKAGRGGDTDFFYVETSIRLLK